MRPYKRLQRLEQVLGVSTGPSLVEVLAAVQRARYYALASLRAALHHQPLPMQDPVQAAADQRILSAWHQQQRPTATPDPAALPKLLEQLATLRQRHRDGRP